MVLFIILYKVAQTFSLWMKPSLGLLCDRSSESYGTIHSYVLFFTLSKVVLTFKSGLNSNERFRAFLSAITIYYLILGGVSFELWITQYSVNILMES